MAEPSDNVLLRIDNYLATGGVDHIISQARSVIVGLLDHISTLEAEYEPPQDVANLQERLATLMAQVDNMKDSTGDFEECKKMALDRGLTIPQDITDITALFECTLGQMQRKAGRKPSERKESQGTAGAGTTADGGTETPVFTR